MKARVVGGMLDGQEIDAMGVHLEHPFTDNEHARAHHEWFQKYGISKAWAMAGHTDRDYKLLELLPPEPRFPAEIYEWALADDGTYELRFDRIER